MKDDYLKKIEDTCYSYRRAIIETRRSDAPEEEKERIIGHLLGVVNGLGYASEIILDREPVELQALLYTGEGPDREQL